MKIYVSEKNNALTTSHVVVQENVTPQTAQTSIVTVYINLVCLLLYLPKKKCHLL